MSQIRPFQAIRPVKNKVCLVPTYSVDHYSKLEINRLIRFNPYSFLNVIAKPYVRHLPLEKRYASIRKKINKFLKTNVLLHDNIPSFYLLRITTKTGDQFTGFVGLASTDEYLEGNIRRHEKTLENRVKLFTDYLYHVRLNAEPVLLAHKPAEDIEKVKRDIQTQIPVYEFSMNDGTVFEAWTVSRHEDIYQIQKAFAGLEALYIADGHHRVESSARLKQRMQDENPYHTGLEFYNYFMAFFLPWDQLKIYGYNRGVKNMPPVDKKDFVRHLLEKFQVEFLGKLREPAADEAIITFDGKEFIVIKIPREYLDRGLSVPEVVNREIVEKLIPPGRKPEMIYCPAKNSNVCITKRIKTGECKMALFLPPVPFETIKRKADNGETLPPKSTYIDPKLLSGLFIFEF
ncbi:MAG: DUF1015 domain-containing protein [Chlorobi bacterium]|nr:DUF1015 domain-containing protein [Chlorobiota bacterium]